MAVFNVDGMQLVDRLYMPDKESLYFVHNYEKESRLMRADLGSGDLQQIFPNIEDGL